MSFVEPTVEEIKNMVCLEERWIKAPTGEVIVARWIEYKSHGETCRQFLGTEITAYKEVPFKKVSLQDYSLK
jgi:hypothetical protein